MSDEAFGWLVLSLAVPALLLSIWIVVLSYLDNHYARQTRKLDRLLAENNYEIEQAAR